MALQLARVVVGVSGQTPTVIERAPTISDGDLALLVSYDSAARVDDHAERCIPLGARRWAINRRTGVHSVWRIAESTDIDRLGGHPAWVWAAESWLDPGGDPTAGHRAPAALPLRHLVRLMAPVGGRNRRTIKALAALTGAIRTGVPVALVVDAELLRSASHPARWLALAMLAILPSTLRDGLRISIGDQSPDADRVDLAICSTAPDGFAIVSAASPPDEGEDLVAYYVRNRLYDDDPEALEAASHLYDGSGERWSDGISALIRDGLPGVSEVDDALVQQDPERAVRALTARLRAGATLHAAIHDRLVSLTIATRDARPWASLARRPALQRADAVDALLQRADAVRPTAELVLELLALYPRGAPLELWVPALLHWLQGGGPANEIVQAIQTTMLEWPLSATGPTRASVWTEVVRCLVELGDHERAMDALRSPLAREIARDGAGRALVGSWATVPPGSRDPAHMEALVSMLHGVPDGDRAVADLFRHVRNYEAEAVALIEAWVQRSIRSPSVDDPLFAAVRDTPYLRTWAETLLDETDGTGDPSAWAPLGTHPLWAAIADAVVSRASDPRAALLGLAAVPGLGRASGRAALLAEAALRATSFPDPELAAAAESLARTPDAPPLWATIAVTAAAPDVWDDDTVDSTLVEFCTQPADEASAQTAVVAFEQLGAATGWEGLDHARWVVRLALAPWGPLNGPLLGALLEGIRRRPDATDFLAAVVSPLLDLPDDHPAALRLVAQLAPAGWRGSLLQRALELVRLERFAAPLRPTLLALAGTDGC